MKKLSFFLSLMFLTALSTSHNGYAQAAQASISTSREDDLQDILNKTFLDTPFSEKLFYMYATQVLDDSPKKMDADELLLKLQEKLKSPELFMQLCDDYQSFSDDEIRQLRAIFDDATFQKYVDHSMDIAQKQHAFVKTVLRGLSNEYGTVDKSTQAEQNAQIIELSSVNFQKEVKRSSKPVIIDVYATWCGPCRAMEPIFKKIAAKYDSITFAKVNADLEPAICEEYSVQGLPTLLFIKNGKVVMKSEGLCNAAEFDKKIQEFLK